MPSVGTSAYQKWIDQAPRSAVHLIAAGSFDLAMQVLNRSCGIVNFAPLKKRFLQIHLGAQFEYPTLPNAPSLRTGLSNRSGTSPALCLSISYCADLLNQAYAAFKAGKDLSATLQLFREILHVLPFLPVQSAEQSKEAKDLIDICREYITALRIELARREESDNLKKAKLAVLFAECKLQPMHMFIGYQVAIKSQRSVNNSKTAGVYCRKFLELAQTQQVPRQIEGLIPQVRELLMACEREEKDANPLGFEIRSGSQICAGSFGIIPFGDSMLKCGLCSSSYMSSFKKSVCATCDLSSVGSTLDGSYLH